MARLARCISAGAAPCLLGWCLCLLVPAAALAQATTPSVTLPTIEIVVQSSPLPGGDIDRDKVPANTVTLSPADLDHKQSSSLPEALLQRAPSVFINDATGNYFQPNVQYRGFTASPVLGTPQGLAVYQNGVRINEVFGDTVNWDLIPEMAINQTTLVPNNPVYGLNALGGAISIEMKDGFKYQGIEGELRGGSFGRRAFSAQAGGQQGNVAGYFAADALNDDGWRDRSASELRRFYADLGWREDRTELHVNFTGASNTFGATAPAPVELLNRNWNAVYTTPQTTRNDLAFLTANGSYHVNDQLTLNGVFYYRGFRQSHVDGNTSDVAACDPPNGFLCFGDATTLLLSTSGTAVPDTLGGALPGQIDRTQTNADSFGGSLQATSTSKLFEHDNHVVVGTSIDRGRVNFSGSSELGTIGADLFITGTGVTISQPDSGVAPVQLLTRNTYTGIYATDTFDVTSALAVTAGGRYNVAQIELDDQLGTALNGSHRFDRFNPVIGATYKIMPTLTAYAGYSEANRAPTPSELGCADPAHPCLLDNFVTSDPDLKQVVSRTYEAGLRGNVDLEAGNGRITWNLGAFRTTNSNDILNVPSDIPGRGFFQNVGGTRRQGLEASADYHSERWNAYVSYSYIDATFLDTITLASPNNPLATAPDPTQPDNRVITVLPGDRIPSAPQHRFKAGGEVAVTEAWKVGLDLLATSGQYLVGDEANLNPQLPGYWTVNLHTSYKLSPQVEVFGLVQNLFNQRYYTFGTFFDTKAIPFLGLTDPRSLSPGAPLAAYVGLRAKF
jgi:iron complex outermembrane recepter protein